MEFFTFRGTLYLFILLHIFHEGVGQSVGSPCNGVQYAPDPTDCESFLQCDHYRFIRQRCSTGLHWNRKSNSCDWPAVAGCRWDAGPNPNPNPGQDSCRSDTDCTYKLGTLSKCRNYNCECFDTLTGGKNEVTLYQGQCVYRRRLGDLCERDEECRAGGHYKANCRPHHGYFQGSKVCQCPNGNLNSCDRRNSSGQLAPLQLFGMIFPILMTIFIVS